MSEARLAALANRSTKIKNRHDLAERLAAMGAEITYDIRAARMVRDGKPMTDMDVDLLVDDSCDGHGPSLPTFRSDTGKRVWNAYLSQNSFDPLKEYLEACHAEHNPDELGDPAKLPFELWPDRLQEVDRPLIEWCWGAMFDAVVLRAYNPPARWDIVPIIKGEQGCGKSTAVTNLLPEQWTNGGMPLKGVKNFDAARQTMEFTEGKAILESSEMVGLTAANREVVKAFVSRHTDRATRKYAIQAEDVPRRWVIVGTTNDPMPVPYDPSGGRRFIATVIKDTYPDDGRRVHEWLERYRSRYWACAFERYKQGLVTEGSLGVPDDLADLHATHVQSHMWTPPSREML